MHHSCRLEKRKTCNNALFVFSRSKIPVHAKKKSTSTCKRKKNVNETVYTPKRMTQYNSLMCIPTFIPNLLLITLQNIPTIKVINAQSNRVAGLLELRSDCFKNGDDFVLKMGTILF